MRLNAPWEYRWPILWGATLLGCTTSPDDEIAARAGQQDAQEAGAPTDDPADSLALVDAAVAHDTLGDGGRDEPNDSASADAAGLGTPSTPSNGSSAPAASNANQSSESDPELTTQEDGTSDVPSSNSRCNDGNEEAGDGCSPKGEIEPGFTCTTATACDSGDAPCKLTVQATYRDFSATDADFDHGGDRDCGLLEGDPVVAGSVASQLDQEGRPVFATPATVACIDSAESFSRWYRAGVKKEATLTLYSNGQGGYVNRFGANGEQLQVIGRTGSELQVNGATSYDTCEPGCTERTRGDVQCENECRPDHDRLDSLVAQRRYFEYQLSLLQQELALEEAADVPDEALIATLGESIAETQSDLDAIEADVPELAALASQCDTECQAEFDAQVAACVVDCKPCSYSPKSYCTGGAVASYDGTPVFFPVDDITGPTSDLAPAQLAEAFGYTGWPDEEDFFPGAPDHNFYFTTELQHWFRFDPSQSQVLTFAGDDDLWVFINGKLAVDLGGIHTPITGTFTLDAQAGTEFGLVAGQVYPIAVFHAERTVYGSTLLVTMPNSGDFSRCTPAR